MTCVMDVLCDNQYNLSGITCQDGHFICSLDLSALMQMSNVIIPLSCPVGNCQASPYDEHELVQVISRDAYNAYKILNHLHIEEAIRKEISTLYDNKIQQIYGDSSEVIIAKYHCIEIVDKILASHCPECGQEFNNSNGCPSVICSRASCLLLRNDSKYHRCIARQSSHSEVFLPSKTSKDHQKEVKARKLLSYLNTQYLSINIRDKIGNILKKDLIDLDNKDIHKYFGFTQQTTVRAIKKTEDDNNDNREHVQHHGNSYRQIVILLLYTLSAVYISTLSHHNSCERIPFLLACIFRLMYILIVPPFSVFYIPIYISIHLPMILFTADEYSMSVFLDGLYKLACIYNKFVITVTSCEYMEIKYNN